MNTKTVKLRSTKKNKPSVKSISERVYQPHIVSEVDTADKYDKPSDWCDSDNSDDALKNEIELFEQNETAVTVFKPNYRTEISILLGL